MRLSMLLEKKNLPFLRRWVQLGFLFFCLAAGWQFFRFYLWAAGYSAAAAARPPAVEGFLPISGLMGLKRLVVTGSYDMIHPAGLTIFLAALAVSLLSRKGFCGWICPVGAVSNLAEAAGRRMKILTATPTWLNRLLAAPKYLLLFFFLYVIVWRMSPEQIESFHASTYNVVADAKMLFFFFAPGPLGAGVLAALVGVSLFVRNFWCRFLCPYGALLGLVAFFGPLRVRRNADACIQCGKCARVCPAAIAVPERDCVRDNACVGCLDCVAACPVENCLETACGRRVVPPLAAAAAGLAVFFGFWLWARASGHWQTSIPIEVFKQFYPLLAGFGHPSY